MSQFNCHKIVFSSSATVYGPQAAIPYEEQPVTGPSNVYGRTKFMVENIFRDICNANKGTWQAILLRYFNPIGAHPSGLMGEDPQGIPNNLMPFIAQVAVGMRNKLSVFGNDYATIDGTGVRDYIHVIDLAKGHVAAVEALQTQNNDCQIYNLGSGTGTSVLQLIKAFEEENGIRIPYQNITTSRGRFT